MLSSVACGLYKNFAVYLIKGTIFERKKNFLNIKIVLIFSTTLVWNISHSSENSTRYDKRTLVFMKSIRYCHILRTLEASRQIFRKFSNIRLHKNPLIGSRAVPWGRTDSQTHMKKLTVAFHKFLKAHNINCYSIDEKGLRRPEQSILSGTAHSRSGRNWKQKTARTAAAWRSVLGLTQTLHTLFRANSNFN